MPNKITKTKSASGATINCSSAHDRKLHEESQGRVVSSGIREGKNRPPCPSLADKISVILALLGKGVAASRVWVCRNLDDLDGAMEKDTVFGWNVTRDIILDNSSISSRCDMARKLAVDQISTLFYGNKAYQKIITDQLPHSSLRQLLEKQKVHSMLSVPIFVQNIWWGTLGLDDCDCEVERDAEQMALFDITTSLIEDTITHYISVAQANQFAILQEMVGCSTWRFSFKSKKVWCCGKKFSPFVGENETRTMSLTEFIRLIHPKSRKPFVQKIKSLAEHSGAELAIDILIGANGAMSRWVKIRGCADGKSDGKVDQFAGIAIDISNARKETEPSAENGLGRSVISEVFSRRRVSDALKTQLLNEKENALFSLLIVDLRHMREVIANYGQVSGDLVLQHFVSLCKQSLRSNDQIGRIGGEEFIIILPSTNVHSSGDVAHRIRGSFKQSPYKVGDIEIATTVSVGGVNCDNFKMKQQKFQKMTNEPLSVSTIMAGKKLVGHGIISVESDATH